MNKFYLVAVFFCFTFFAKAQNGKISDSGFLPDISSKIVKFYPNPATSIINFEFSKPVQKDYVLQVFNFVGKKVFESSAVLQKSSIPLTDFYRGIYIFQLRDKTGRIIESGKFQVNR